MTRPDGSKYSVEERKNIVAEARANAARLLELLELLEDPDATALDAGNDAAGRGTGGGDDVAPGSK